MSPTSDTHRSNISHPLVTHCQLSLYDVYIGLPVASSPVHLSEHIWDTTLSPAEYEHWLLHPEQAEFVAKAKKELKGKVLGCWCKANRLPEDTEEEATECHGVLLAEVGNESPDETEMRRQEFMGVKGDAQMDDATVG